MGYKPCHSNPVTLDTRHWHMNDIFLDLPASVIMDHVACGSSGKPERMELLLRVNRNLRKEALHWFNGKSKMHRCMMAIFGYISPNDERVSIFVREVMLKPDIRSLWNQIYMGHNRIDVELTAGGYVCTGQLDTLLCECFTFMIRPNCVQATGGSGNVTTESDVTCTTILHLNGSPLVSIDLHYCCKTKRAQWGLAWESDRSGGAVAPAYILEAIKRTSSLLC